ncbi:MAG: ABC transporter permease [Gammaproteobacteria bacterium]|nr:ABC transporter permease [Gammaproteobacteria bacterium]
MMITPVFLWTDILLGVLLVFLSIYVFHVWHTPPLRQRWQQILRRPIGAVSLLVLLTYLLVAVLDSMHFRTSLAAAEHSREVHYSVEVLSVLDVILTSLRNAQERTYSAPFATHAYVRETLLVAGVQQRIYPRLKYGGAHLDDPAQDRGADLKTRLGLLLVKGVVFSAAFILLLASWMSARGSNSLTGVLSMMIRGKGLYPWRSLALALLVFFMLLFMITDLSSLYHILGTDKVGQDVLYQTIKSVRTGLVIGTLTTLVMLPFAIILGAMAGYFRGWIDDLIQYLYTTLNSVPGVLLIAASVLMLQIYMDKNPEAFETMAERADMRLLFLCLILGITSWTGLCRMLRGEVLKLREMEYIQAARCFGVSHVRIILRHILPNVMHIILITVVLDFSGLVLAEAVLSYIGIGVDPTTFSWGNMINSARLEMAREPVVWWSLMAAFISMFVLVLSANLFADVVRDAFDPRTMMSGGDR